MLSEADLETISNVNFLTDFSLSIQKECSEYLFIHTYIYRRHTHMPQIFTTSLVSTGGFKRQPKNIFLPLKLFGNTLFHRGRIFRHMWVT